MIEVKSVDAGYSGGLVLRDVSLTIPEGETTCIVGPNGAGKSTMLKVMCDDLTPSSGEVHIGGRRVTGLTSAGAIDCGVVMIPQSNALFPEMTVRENVLLGAHAVRRSARDIAERYAELAQLFPVVGERARTHAGLLSGGQRRMVEFARALMSRPRVVLLDEPSIGLDPKSLEILAASVRTMAEAGTTVVLVEQNVRFGLSFATTGVIMEGGRVFAVGPAGDLLEDPAMRAVFLGGHAKSVSAGHRHKEVS